MKIERFRTKDGLMLRARGKDAKPLFKHCSGADVVPSRQYKQVSSLLFLHGVYMIEIVNHASV